MMKFVANFSNAVAWVTGNARDTAAMMKAHAVFETELSAVREALQQLGRGPKI